MAVVHYLYLLLLLRMIGLFEYLDFALMVADLAGNWVSSFGRLIVVDDVGCYILS